jgi:lipooligosaccharide transport system permease protein
MILSGFVEPVLYLGAFGYGLGNFIGNVQVDSTHSVSYATFLAPALLANSAMNGAMYEATWNVFFKMNFSKLYQGIMATSMGPLDVALGEITACLLRGFVYAVAFMGIMLPLGLIPCWWGGLLAIPASVFIAFGFASCFLAITSYMKSFQQLDWVSFALLPMLLFSGSFYSLNIYPAPIRILLEALPLHQGVALIRGLTLGQLDYALLGHLAYFTVMAVGGVIFATKRMDALFLR